MQHVSALSRAEVETYFDVIAAGGSARRIRARAFHNLGEWTFQDYKSLSDTLRDVDSAASFSFLGREADRHAETIAYLDTVGHEIVLHGYRHVGCANITYGLAHENITRGIRCIENAGGVTPVGFIAPRQTVNDVTLRVLSELDFDWVLGNTDATVPDGLSLHEVCHPYDLIILNEGADPNSAFERIRAQSESGAAILFHPNMLEYYDGLTELDEWITTTRPVTISTMIEEGGIGMINDAMRPLPIEGSTHYR